ncbi:ubiquitin-conjugating enzyme E2 U isoform X5 [Rhinolophus sinicus]|uniref:ubiquitin-conjugating enzyme E2 U isoform X5 n=1 Tax=Rhinolophus sinicus TaxID=89399 RepID=UPI003D7A5B2F
MYCRAYFVLQRDFQELKNNNYEGITAFPVSEDMMEWEANIEGLQNTFWRRIFFQLTINFTPEYNFVPPVVTFRTIPFHPNVDQHTGRPCIDFLDNTDEWNTSYTLSSILLTLQIMLSNPVLNNPVNLEAAQMLTEDETKYKLIIRRLFHESLQLAKDDSSKSPEDSHKFVRSIKISFDDYYKTWSEIATSKAAECYRTPCKCSKIQISLRSIINGRKGSYNILKNGISTNSCHNFPSSQTGEKHLQAYPTPCPPTLATGLGLSRVRVRMVLVPQRHFRLCST